jgi:hypothetical protein
MHVKTPWHESASELHRPRDRRLSAKLVPTFANTGCHMVSVTDPYGRIVGFLDRLMHVIKWKLKIVKLVKFHVIVVLWALKAVL